MLEVDLVALRGDVRQWAAGHVPAGWRALMTDASDADFLAFQREWLGTLRTGGYAVPHWPAEWEGGFSVAEQAVIAEEMVRAGAPRLSSHFVSLNHAAATLFEAGTDELRQRFLPGILDGELWCQGFSEPEAGSDLASLRTRAVRRGDEYIVSGQKLWSSYARHARWCLLLARTDADAPKRKGISYFILDLQTPGVEVRPILNASGESEFCEIFLDEVAIPVDMRLGAENDGWRVAQSTLVTERGVTMVELVEGLSAQLDRVAGQIREAGPEQATLLVDLGRLGAQVRALRLLVEETVSQIAAGHGAPASSALLKLQYSELLQRISDLGLEVSGIEGHVYSPKARGVGWHSGPWMLDYLGSWEWTIGGGTNEVLRNVVAERLLGLPREPEVMIP